MRPNLSQSIWPPHQPANKAATFDIHPGARVSPSPVPASMRPASSQAIADAGLQSAPSFEPAKFGEMVHNQLAHPGGVDVLALIRPVKSIRSFLLIANELAATIIHVNYDNPAGAAVGTPIGPGGNLFLDAAVPQNDVHIFSPVAGNIQISYINIDPTNATKVVQATS